MKRISKVIAALSVFALIFSALALPAAARAEEEGVKVYMYNTLGWEKVYIYSWAENSNAPEMTPMAESSSENWYEFTFSKDMGTGFEFLLYNGEWQGFNQTVNITAESADDLYVVVQPQLAEGGFSANAEIKVYASEAEAAAAGYPEYTPVDNGDGEPTDTPAPAVGSFTVYFKNTPEWARVGTHGWGDNALEKTEMTALEDGWFSYTFAQPAAGTFNMYFFDFDADAAGQYGAGVQTGNMENMAPKGSCVWVVPDENGDISNGIYEEKQDAAWPGEGGEAKEDDPGQGQTSKIYFYDSQGWGKVSIWSWDTKYTDQLVAGNWPGDAMTELGDGWFSYDLSSSLEYALLFNNGEESNTQQTADYAGLTPGGKYWFTVQAGINMNETGIGGGINLDMTTEPLTGWPEGPEGEMAPIAANTDDVPDKTEPEATATPEPTKGEAPASSDHSDAAAEKTGSAVPVIIAIAAAAVIIVIAAVVVVRNKSKKK